MTTRRQAQQHPQLEELFSFLSEQYGSGDPYQTNVRGFVPKFTVQKLFRKGKFFQIAISKEKNLTTIIFFADSFHWSESLWRLMFLTGKQKDSITDLPAVIIHDGRLGPAGDFSYKRLLRVGTVVPPDHPFFEAFKMEDLERYLGVPLVPDEYGTGFLMYDPAATVLQTVPQPQLQ